MAIETGGESQRLLVVANEACAGDALFAEIRQRTGERAEVLVLAPALTERLRFWMNDEALGRAAAEDLLSRSFAACAHEGLKVRGEVGDPDPLQAIDDAIQTFDPDAMVIVTHPAGEQNWLERDVVAQARARYALPITHFAVEDGRAAFVPAGPDEGLAVERRGGRGGSDAAVLLVALLLAFMGTLAWVLALAFDWSDRMSMAWVLVLDFGLKAIAALVLWRLFMRRGRADRLDF